LECFYIEEELKKRLDIPVFHDDQHGTAIIAGAALLNALEVAGKRIDQVRMVVSGAGASAIACTRLMLRLGLTPANVMMVDTTGVIYRGRTKGMNSFKEEFAVETPCRTLTDAMKGADVFLGLSAKDLVTPEMLLSMAAKPIVFAMANPDPEIDYHLAKSTRSDVIMATGRSDFPNQVNNVLGFPYIFRGALDVRAREINEEMKLAAVRALAELAREPVPESVRKAYARAAFSFGPEYLIPKPFDPRVLYHVSPAVAKAAIESGAARQSLDIDAYTLRLKAKQNYGREMLSVYYGIAHKSKSRAIALPEATNEKVLKAAVMAADEQIAEPVLVGDAAQIRQAAERYDLDISGCTIIEPVKHPKFAELTAKFFHENGRAGVTRIDAERELRHPHHFANALLASGEVDGLICGVDRYFPAMVRPILRTIGLQEGATTAAGLYIVSIKGRTFFLTDTSINTHMTSEKLAEIAIMAAEFAESMNVTPRVAMLSYSNFGSVKHPSAQLVVEATKLAKQRAPQIEIDGEMQVDTAVVPGLIEEDYPFCTLSAPANVLVFPDMQSGNIAYKLLQRLGGARVIGPVILGLNAPAHVMQRHAGVDEVFNMITVAVAQATLRSRREVSGQ
jgi:malate dehydrogenase (oxaloacetate-decarboxylating)(NADP+)